MKRLSFLLILISAALSGLAQPFQGTVTYGISMTNLPAGVDPAMFGKLMPTKATYQFGKDGAFRYTMDGPAGVTVLIPPGSKDAYMIQDSRKKIMRIPEEQIKKYQEDPQRSKPQVIRTDETETVLGYVCRKYIMVNKSGKSEVKTDIWVTDKIMPVRPRFENKGYFSDDMPGMPLKMMVRTGGMDMVLTATEVKAEALPDSLFAKPSGYEEEDISDKQLKAAYER